MATGIISTCSATAPRRRWWSTVERMSDRSHQVKRIRILFANSNFFNFNLIQLFYFLYRFEFKLELKFKSGISSFNQFYRVKIWIFRVNFDKNSNYLNFEISICFTTIITREEQRFGRNGIDIHRWVWEVGVAFRWTGWLWQRLHRWEDCFDLWF